MISTLASRSGSSGCGLVLLLTSPWTSSGVSFAQYFEANCGYGSRPYIYMRPALDNTTAPLIKLNYDIVLNGAPSFHDGDSDYEKWGPIDWQYGRACTYLRTFSI